MRDNVAVGRSTSRWDRAEDHGLSAIGAPVIRVTHAKGRRNTLRSSLSNILAARTTWCHPPAPHDLFVRVGRTNRYRPRGIKVQRAKRESDSKNYETGKFRSPNHFSCSLLPSSASTLRTSSRIAASFSALLFSRAAIRAEFDSPRASARCTSACSSFTASTSGASSAS